MKIQQNYKINNMFQRIFRVIWITFFKRVLNLIPTQTCLDFAENILKGFQLKTVTKIEKNKVKRIRENWSKGIWCLFSEVVINHFSRRWTLLMCVTFILRISNKKSYLLSTTNVYLLMGIYQFGFINMFYIWMTM